MAVAAYRLHASGATSSAFGVCRGGTGAGGGTGKGGGAGGTARLAQVQFQQSQALSESNCAVIGGALLLALLAYRFYLFLLSICLSLSCFALSSLSLAVSPVSVYASLSLSAGF